MKVAVVNLQSGIGVTKGYREYFTSGWKYVLPHSPAPLKKAGELLRDQDIDVALFTEVEEHALRSGFVPQSELIKKHSGLPHYEFFPTRTFEPLFDEGNCIFSRFPIVSTNTHLLTCGSLPRVMGETVIETPHGKVHVYVAHLGLRQRYRKEQIREIADIVKRGTEPAILGGDFNERDHAAFDAFMKAGFAYRCTLPNFPSWNPKHSLDVLFLTKHFSVEKHYLPKSSAFSDHLPLIVETVRS